MIHEFGTNHVPWSHGARHEESRQHAGTKDGTRILALPSRRFCHVALGDIVAAHFRRIQDTCPPNVGTEASIEPTNALVLIHASYKRCQRDRFPLVRLRQSLHDVKGVAHDGAHTARDGASEKLEIKGRILVAGANGISDGRICA